VAGNALFELINSIALAVLNGATALLSGTVGQIIVGFVGITLVVVLIQKVKGLFRSGN